MLNSVAGTVGYMFKNLVVHFFDVFIKRVYPVAVHAT